MTVSSERRAPTVGGERASPPSIELRGVEKRYGSFVAVADLSLAVPPGVIFGLLGPNGAGKTTTLRMLMNILAPDSGEILLFGRPRQAADLARLGYLPEERGLYRKMKVVDQLLFLAEIHGVKRRQALPAIRAWLARVELARWEDKKVEELSKGMQQKVQLIGTVLHEPEVLILDEPFSGLDPINQELFKEMLLDLRRQGKTILFSTHGMEQAEKLCDHIGLIARPGKVAGPGRVVLAGELRAIKRRLGGNSYRLTAAGDLGLLDAVPGVEHVVRREGDAESAKLLLRAEASPGEVLRQIVTFLDVREFRSEEPDLEEIFIKAVRDAA